MQRHRLNVKLLIVLLVGSLVLVIGGFVLHDYQIRHDAHELRARADARIAEAQDQKKKGAKPGVISDLYQDAVKLYNQYTKVRPDDHEALADFCFIMADRAEMPDVNPLEVFYAYRTLATAIREMPENDDVRLKLIDFCMTFGRYNEVFDHLTQLMDKRPDDVDLKIKYGVAKMRTRERDDAIDIFMYLVGYDSKSESFEEAKPIGLPDSYTNWWGKGIYETDAYVHLGALLRTDPADPDTADNVMDQLVNLQPGAFSAFLERGRYAHTHQTAEAAKEDVARALELIQLEKSEIIRTLKQSEYRVSALEEYLEDQKSQGPLSKLDERVEVLLKYDAESILIQAELAMLEDDYETARKALEPGVQAFPRNEQMYLQLASLDLNDEENVDGALDWVDKGLAVIPTGRRLLLLKADIQLRKQDIEGVRKMVRELRENSFGQELPTYILARLDILNGDIVKASKKLEEVAPKVGTFPSLAVQVNLILGRCYQRMGQPDLAMERYKMVLAMDPDSAVANQGIEQIKRLIVPSVQQPEQQLVEDPLAEAAKRVAVQPKEQQDWTEVEKMLKQVQEHPEISAISKALRVVQVRMIQQRGDDARRLLQDVRRDHTEDPRALEVWLLSANIADKPEDGLKLLVEAEERFAAKVKIRLAKARLLLRMAHPDAQTLIAELEKAADTLDENLQLEFWVGMAGIYEQHGMSQESLRCYKHLAKTNPKDLPFRVMLFDLALQDGDNDRMLEALEAIKTIVASEDDPLWQYCEAARIVSQVRAKRLDYSELERAQRLVNNAKYARKRWQRIHRLQGHIYLLQEKEDDAIENFTRSLTLGPADVGTVRQLSYLLTRRGDFRQAQSVLDMTPPYALLEEKATNLMRLQQTEKALIAGANAVRREPNNPNRQMWFGRLLIQANRPADADTPLRQAVRLASKDERTWLALIQYLTAVGRSDDAEKELRNAQLALDGDQETLFLAQANVFLKKFKEAEGHYQTALRAQPDNPAMVWNVARFYLNQYPFADKRNKAQPLLNQLLDLGDRPEFKHHPIVMMARREGAKLLSITSDYKKAQQAEQLLRQNAGDDKTLSPTDHLLLARILVARAEPISRRRSRDLYEEYDTSWNLPTKDRLILAELYDQEGNWAVCREQIEKLLVDHGSSIEVLVIYVQKLIKHDELDNATRYLQRLEKLDPNSLNTLSLKVRLLAKRGRSDLALAIVQKLMPKDPSLDNVNRLVTVAKLMESIDQIEKAEAIYRVVSKVDPNQSMLLAQFLGEHGDVGEALETLEKGVKEHSGAWTWIIRNAIQILRDRRHEVGDQYDGRVESWLKNALRKNPNSRILTLRMAELRDVQAQYPEVLSLYRQLLERKDLVGSERAIVLNNLAFILAVKRQDLSEANDHISEAINLFGPVADLLDTRAMVRMANQDFKAAVNDLNLALDDGPTNTRYFHLALAYEGDKKLNLARENFRRAQEMGLTVDSVTDLERKSFRRMMQKYGQVRDRNGISSTNGPVRRAG